MQTFDDMLWGVRFSDGTDGPRGIYRNFGKSVVRIPEVSDLIELSGLWESFGHLDPYYAFRGTITHKAISLDLAGELDEKTVDPRIEGFVEASRLFRDDWNLSTLRPTLVEQLLVDQEGRRFGGIIDVGWTREETTLIVDWKTGRTEYQRYDAQAGAYIALAQQLINAGFLPPGEALFVFVQLKADGRYRTRTPPVGLALDRWAQTLQAAAEAKAAAMDKENR